MEWGRIETFSCTSARIDLVVSPMHAVIRNELRLDFSIIPVSPLSIQGSGTPSQFVRALHPRGDEMSIYIPSSTLKGALRGTCEQILHSVDLQTCDPEHPCADQDR